MSSQIFGIAEDHVAQWAALNTDISLLHEVLEMWEQEQLESVTNSFRTKRNSIMKVV
jgi:hypothetical protein